MVVPLKSTREALALYCPNPEPTTTIDWPIGPEEGATVNAASSVLVATVKPAERTGSLLPTLSVEV